MNHVKMPIAALSFPTETIFGGVPLQHLSVGKQMFGVEQPCWTKIQNMLSLSSNNSTGYSSFNFLQTGDN
jgi:hypothetical protein